LVENSKKATTKDGNTETNRVEDECRESTNRAVERESERSKIERESDRVIE